MTDRPANPNAERQPDDAIRSENADRSPQGRVIEPASDVERQAAVDLAFDYRGDVTVDTADGRSLVGYVYNRQATGAEPKLKMMLADGGEATLTYRQVQRIAFTGKDPAAGQTWENWLKRYVEQKAAGETAGIRSDFDA